jgi:hypothetical protein
MNRRGRSALVMALVLCLVVVSVAQAGLPTPASGETWAPNQKVTYRWKDDSVPPAWIRPAINAAAADSNQTRASRAAIFSFDAEAVSWIGYTADMATGAIGYAVRNVPNSFKVRLRPHGFVFDWGTLRWCQFYDAPPTGCYDAEMVTLHELGHVQTLGHIDDSPEPFEFWTDSIMHAGVKSKAKAGWNLHEWGRCDVARLQIRYQPLDTTTPISTCMSLPTTAGLAASSTSVAYGALVSFTATLSISPDAQYPKLAGDRLSERTVVLQRRASANDAWSTYANMKPLSDGTGRYVYSPRIYADFDWRARFVAPDTEGLTSSSSSSQRVTIGGCSLNCGCTAEAITAAEEPDGENPEYYPCSGSAAGARFLRDGRG